MTFTSRRTSKQVIKPVRVAAAAAIVLTTTLGATAQQASDLPVERITPAEARAILSTMPRHAMPLKTLRSKAREDKAPHPNFNCPFPKLTNHGGPVVSNVEVVAVWWGAGVEATLTDATSGLPAFYKTVTNGPYMDWLHEYNTGTQTIGRGRFKTAVQITPSTTNKMLSDEDIGAEIVAQIKAGKLPAPSTDAKGNHNTLYMIDFPSGYTIKLGQDQSCVRFCAYHSSATYNGKPVGYGVHPFMGQGSQCARGCGDNAKYMDNVTSIHSHELIEAVTDIAVSDNNLAWYDENGSCGEIGDICDTGQSSNDDSTIDGWAVQNEWSNAKGACVASVPCTSNADCTAPAATCDTGSGRCVQCAKNADCSGATPVCNVQAGTCRACGADTECGAGLHCDTSSDANKGRCVECTSNAQCANPKPACGKSNTCGGCTSDADCASNPAGTSCDKSTGACAKPAAPAPDAGGVSPGPTGGSSGDADAGSSPSAANGDVSSSSDAASNGGGGCSVSTRSTRASTTPFALGALIVAAALALSRITRKRA